MTEPTVIPEWVCLLVGRLVLEQEALRLQLEAGQPRPPVEDTEED